MLFKILKRKHLQNFGILNLGIGFRITCFYFSYSYLSFLLFMMPKKDTTWKLTVFA